MNYDHPQLLRPPGRRYARDAGAKASGARFRRHLLRAACRPGMRWWEFLGAPLRGLRGQRPVALPESVQQASLRLPGGFAEPSLRSALRAVAGSRPRSPLLGGLNVSLHCPGGPEDA